MKDEDDEDSDADDFSVLKDILLAFMLPALTVSTRHEPLTLSRLLSDGFITRPLTAPMSSSHLMSRSRIGTAW